MTDHVYKHIELTGSSTKSSDDAIAVAIRKAAQSLRNMHWFRVTETRGVVDKDKITHWQVTVTVGFTLED
jgi:flavin-binding protein dodecin